MRPSSRRGSFVVPVTLAALACSLLLASDEAVPAAADRGAVLVLRVDSIIHPVALEYILDGLEEAKRSEAQALVIEIDTPGGVLDSTHEITTAMLGADLPVVVFVEPSGARAASAGFIILMAADVAAMAPGTNTGAAHPVGLGGTDIKGTMGKKVEEDTAANIRSLAARNHRDVELAQSAVIESKSFTASEALEKGLVDVVADDLEHLLDALDGRTVSKNGVEHVLHTRDAVPRELEMTAFQKIRSILVHPNVAAALLSVAMLAIYFELASPGAILPGVVGAICLILGGYGLSVLPVSYAGVALLVVAAVLFLLEIKVAGFGVLGTGGVVSLVLGLMMLFKSADPAIRVSIELIVGLALVAAAVVAFLATMVMRVHRQRATTGREGMVSERGVARTDLSPRGKVSVHGEIWDAVSEAPVAAGQQVEVVGIDGLLLRVQPR
ncbi:MAG TPA: nodulation protein NfeD [Thermoanaerobaculia bacterium]|nr:nodulation protein NfeD [Thermoanaerobaculia bacterium]